MQASFVTGAADTCLAIQGEAGRGVCQPVRVAACQQAASMPACLAVFWAQHLMQLTLLSTQAYPRRLELEECTSPFSVSQAVECASLSTLLSASRPLQRLPTGLLGLYISAAVASGLPTLAELLPAGTPPVVQRCSQAAWPSSHGARTGEAMCWSWVSCSGLLALVWHTHLG